MPSLSDEIVIARSLNSIKEKIDCFMKGSFKKSLAAKCLALIFLGMSQLITITITYMKN